MRSVVSNEVSAQVFTATDAQKSSQQVQRVDYDNTNNIDVQRSPSPSVICASQHDQHAARGAQVNASSPQEREQTKRSVALDLGKKSSYCEVKDGRVVQRATLSAQWEFEKYLGPKTPAARVAVEACREAWYYHELLTSWGHQVLLVDTTRVRQLGIAYHKRKNDRIDAEVLARAVEDNRIPLAHLLSPERRKIRAELNIRRALVEARASYVTLIRGLLRSVGIRIGTCRVQNFEKNVRAMNLPMEQRELIEPLLLALAVFNPQIELLDNRLNVLCQKEPVSQLLATCPGVGPIVASSFISVIDEAGRFKKAHQVEAYIGLVPSEDTSGKRRVGAITKQGNGYLRAMLVQAAWTVLRSRGNVYPRQAPSCECHSMVIAARGRASSMADCGASDSHKPEATTATVRARMARP